MKWLLLLFLAGCSAGTEVVVSVSSELFAPDLRSVRIQVTNPSEGPSPIYQSTDLPLCPPGSKSNCYAFPITVTLIPGDAKPGDLVRVEVTASDANGIAISDASVFSFVPGSSQKLDFYLYKSCLQTACSRLDQTCGQSGSCVNTQPTGGAPLQGPGGASKCPAALAAMCDGFEDGTLSRWGIYRGDIYQMPVVIPTNPVIDGTRAYRGSHSLWLHAQGSDDDQINRTIYIYTPTPTPVSWARWFVYPGAGFGPSKIGQLSVGPIDLIARQLQVAADNVSHSSSAVLPPEKWSCLEWMFDGTNGELRLFLDGDEVPELHITGAQEMIDEIGFGVFVYKGPTYDLWMDEVAVDSKRIGCDH